MASRIPASLRVIGRSAVDWWDGWLDMVLVCIVWIFAQFTIVLGPPATFGVYYVVYNMINGQSTGVRGMIEGGRKYFGRAWLWGALNLLAVFTLLVNLEFYRNVQSAWGAFLWFVVVILGMLWFTTQFYALPYFFEQEDQRLIIALRNGILTTLAAPFYTFLIMVLVTIISVVSLVLVLPFFLGLPGMIPMLGYRALQDRLIAFGIRKPEKTPKEIEFEQGGRMNIPEFPSKDNSPSDSSIGRGAGAPGSDVSSGEGQIEQEK